jgi:hypothetical protein
MGVGVTSCLARRALATGGFFCLFVSVVVFFFFGFFVFASFFNRVGFGFLLASRCAFFMARWCAARWCWWSPQTRPNFSTSRITLGWYIDTCGGGK